MSDQTQPARAGAAISKLRSWGILLAGALAALLYGLFVAKLGASAPLVILTAGGLALALCGLALFRVIDPLVRPAAAAARAEGGRQSVRLRELEKDKQLVLKAVREIEHDYQMRKISEGDYKELSQRYRARALRLIREIDAGDDFRTLIEQELKTRVAARELIGRRCTSCATINDADAQFCKKCGQALPAEAGAKS